MVDEKKQHPGESLDEKIARLEASELGRTDALEKTRKLFRAQELELKERFSTECGVQGQEFEIVMTVEGPVAVKRTDMVMHKQFMASFKGEELPSYEAQSRYVSPALLFPEKEKALDLFKRRPAIVSRCVRAILALHGERDAATEGKY